jgi:hypothetical protein
VVEELDLTVFYTPYEGYDRRTDEEEDRLYGEDQRGDELPEELQHRPDQLEKTRRAKARKEQAQREADTDRGRHPDDERKPPRGGRPYSRDFRVPPDKSQPILATGQRFKLVTPIKWLFFVYVHMLRVRSYKFDGTAVSILHCFLEM